MERSMRVVLLLIRVLAIATITFSIGLCNGIPGWPPLCKESERQALLMFKQDLEDPANRLSSWVAEEGSDCCRWTGVVCDHITGHILELHLNSSYFDGTFYASFGDRLDLSNSSFSGSIFHFFCGRRDEPYLLSILHLENNHLTGKVPDCWMNWPSLGFLHLENNNLTGNVPMSMGYLLNLQSLHLRNNHLYGELPHSLENCTMLSVVDLSGNGFVGSIPIWMGKSLSELQVLNLRSNEFEGDIPSEICYLKSLQILDLARNKLSGTIPRCFHNLSAMADLSESVWPTMFSQSDGIMEFTNLENAVLVTKGREMEYSKILEFVKFMDLSCNFMYGEIPEELTDLLALQSLNLSNNRFTGGIPSKIGNMAQLESLDFSMNQLDGEIPPSMTNLTFLSHLNLSYNNLRGRIPKSTQLQSLDQSSFVGNELCGAPLNKNCSANGVMLPPTVEQDGGGGYRLLEDKWFYVSLGVGFFTGFWIVLGSLLVNMPWSILLSQLLNRIVLKMYDVIVEYV
ncbi:unnamed protein product [Malus baccata var. baccata]